MRHGNPTRTLVFLLCAGLALSAAAFEPAKESLRHPEALASRAVVMGPSSQYIECAVDDATGQFTIGIPDGAILLYGHPSPWSSFATVRINGQDYTQETDWTLVQAPSVAGSTNEGIWSIGSTGIEIHQRLTLVQGFSTGNQDTYLIEYEVVNTSAGTHTIGIRLMLDTMLGSNDGAPFRVPGTGSVVAEQEWAGEEVPYFFFVFNDLTDPEVTAQGSLIGGQVAVSPDLFQICSWSGVYNSDFDYTVNPSLGFSDSAYAVYWIEKTLSGGSSFTGGTYYGLGGLSVDSDPPLVTSVITTVSMDCIDGILGPNPFQVALYMENSSADVTGTVTGITATLDVPDGLIIPPGSSVQAVPDLAQGEDQLVSWNVLADGTVRGDIPYTITVDTSNWGSKAHTPSTYVPPDCDVGDLPPIIALTSPSTGTTIQCEVDLAASVQDDIGVQQVVFYVDGLPLSPALTGEPWVLTLDSNQYGNGHHEIYATARDTGAQITESNRITVLFSNPKINRVKFNPNNNKLKVYGSNFQQGDIVAVEGMPLETRFKEKGKKIFRDGFQTLSARWITNASVTTYASNENPDPLPGGGGNNVYIESGGSIARAADTTGLDNIYVKLHYQFDSMDQDEGIYVEYSLSGSDGPWLVAWSRLSETDDHTIEWTKAEAMLPLEANDNDDLWIRISNVTNPYGDTAGKILRVDHVKVVSRRQILKGKNAPDIGHAQTVSVTVRHGNCETNPYPYTRP